MERERGKKKEEKKVDWKERERDLRMKALRLSER